MATEDDLASLPCYEAHTSQDKLLQAAEDISTDLLHDARMLVTKVAVNGDWVLETLGDQRAQLNNLDQRLEALKWLLPMVGPSDKLLELAEADWILPEFRHKHVSPQYDVLFRRVVGCLVQYKLRVEEMKLDDLDYRIKCGDVKALTEKLRTLDLDALD